MQASEGICASCFRTTPEEGGETVFPKAQVKTTGPEWSECAKQVRNFLINFPSKNACFSNGGSV